MFNRPKKILKTFHQQFKTGIINHQKYFFIYIDLRYSDSLSDNCSNFYEAVYTLKISEVIQLQANIPMAQVYASLIFISSCLWDFFLHVNNTKCQLLTIASANF